MVKSERLSAVESLVPHGARLLDIGSDHASVPFDLLSEGRIEAAFVSDVNSAPLERAVRRLSGFGGRVGAALSDGFKDVPAGAYDAAAICGMGGELIARIIAEGGEKAHCPLILQPNTMFHKLRAFLWASGYRIGEELFPTEGGRTYLVLAAEYAGEAEDFTREEAFFGKLRPANEGFRRFAAAVAAAAEKRLAGALIEGNPEAAEIERRLIEFGEGLI